MQQPAVAEAGAGSRARDAGCLRPGAPQLSFSPPLLSALLTRGLALPPGTGPMSCAAGLGAGARPCLVSVHAAGGELAP